MYNTNTNTIQIKLRWALFVTYTIIQSIMRSEMCSLHLTHPSVHTWSSGQPTVQRPGSSRGLPVGDGIRTHNLGLPRVSSPTLYPLGQRLPKRCKTTIHSSFTNTPWPCHSVCLHGYRADRNTERDRRNNKGIERSTVWVFVCTVLAKVSRFWWLSIWRKRVFIAGHFLMIYFIMLNKDFFKDI